MKGPRVFFKDPETHNRKSFKVLNSDLNPERKVVVLSANLTVILAYDLIYVVFKKSYKGINFCFKCEIGKSEGG